VWTITSFDRILKTRHVLCPYLSEHSSSWTTYLADELQQIEIGNIAAVFGMCIFLYNCINLLGL